MRRLLLLSTLVLTTIINSFGQYNSFTSVDSTLAIQKNRGLFWYNKRDKSWTIRFNDGSNVRTSKFWENPVKRVNNISPDPNGNLVLPITGADSTKASLNRPNTFSSPQVITNWLAYQPSSMTAGPSPAQLGNNTAMLSRNSQTGAIGLYYNDNGIIRDLITKSGIRPEDFGAKGDRIADDTGPLRLAATMAVSTGRALITTEGKRYRVTDELTMPGNIVINMEKGSEIWFNTNTPNKQLLKTRYSIWLTGQGTLSGNRSKQYDNTAQVATSKILGQRLFNFSDILIDNATCVVHGITFRDAGEMGLTVSPDRARPTGQIKITNNQFYDCFNGAHLNWLGGTKPLENVLFSGNLIKRCGVGQPGMTFSDAYYYGNGLVTWGPFKKLEISYNKIDSCGRMGIECFINGEQVLTNTNPVANEELQIIGNTITNCGYFCVSQQGNNNVIARNYIKNWHADYIEMLGNHTLVESNYLDGVGFSTTSNDRGAWPKLDRNNMTVRGNTIIQRAFQKEIIQGTYTENLLVEKNIVYCRERPSGTIGFRNPITISNSLNPTIRQNTVVSQYPFNLNAYNLGKNVGMDWQKDVIDLRGYANDSLPGIMSIYNLRNSTIRDIRILTDGPQRVRYNAFDGLHYPITALYSYVSNGTSFSTTALAATSPQTTPPTSPTTGASYWVGESPTGAWANQARKLARWDGSAWQFSTVSDVFPYENIPTREPLYSNIGLPTKANAAGTTYILVDGPGLFNVRFENNDFSAGGRITDNNNKTSFQLFNTILWNVGIVNTTEDFNTNSLKLADVTIQKSVVSASAAAQDLTNYVTKDYGNATYVLQSGSSTGTGSLSIAATDASGNGVINQNGARVFHTYGTENVFIGSSTGNLTLTGIRNTAIGPNTMTQLTTGSRNIGIGPGAGGKNTTGNSNIYLGYLAGNSNVTGNDQIGIGYQALTGPPSTSANTNNVGIGTSAGLNAVGNSNVWVGYDTGGSTVGSNNTSIGNAAGKMTNAATITANYNLFLGNNAGRNIPGSSTITNNVYIGNDAGNGSGSSSNTMYVGTSTTPMTFSLTGNETVTGGLSASSVSASAVIGAGSPVTVTVGAAAGTGATVVASGNAQYGLIVLTTGTGATAGEMVIVSVPNVGNLILYPQVTPAQNTVGDPNTFPINVSNRNSTGYRINTASTPAAGTVYQFIYANNR